MAAPAPAPAPAPDAAGFPALRDTRCYWTVLDAQMSFRYLDPVLRHHLQQFADSMLGKNIVEFIHPDEKAAASEDFARFRSSNSIFGSVTRCRYALISHIRRLLGDQAETSADGDDGVSDDNWANTRVVASLVATNAVLVFFHAATDRDPQADNDNSKLNDWSNWCGPRMQDLQSTYLTQAETQLLTQGLDACRNAAPDSTQTFDIKSPPHIFQILSSESNQVLASWPRPSIHQQNGSSPSSSSNAYSPQEYAGLARAVLERPRAASSDDAETNCTRRYQSKHPIVRDGVLTTVDSVVIGYQDIAFVVFQAAEALSTSQSSIPTVRVESPAMLKRKTIGGNQSEDSQIQNAKLRRQSGPDGGQQLGPGLAPWPAANQHSVSPRTATASAILDSIHADSPQLDNRDLQGTNHLDHGQPGFPAMPSPVHQHAHLTDGHSWSAEHSEQGNRSGLNSPYYPNASYPSVYSSMFAADGRPNQGFMSGSTDIPPMPSPQPQDYNPAQPYGEQSLDPQKTAGLDFLPRQPGEGQEDQQAPASGPTSSSQPVHRVRKSDRNRICTSCGTTNSPEWRKGPSGIKTLCNACGLRYSRAQARKAKKAQKEAESAAAAAVSMGNGADSVGMSTTPTAPYIPAPLQMPPGPASAPLGGQPPSPYMAISDYAHAQHSAPLPPLPPLPQSGGSVMGQHDPSPAGLNGVAAGNGHYGGYSNFVNYAPYGDWSPASNTSFASQQAQGHLHQGAGQGN